MDTVKRVKNNIYLKVNYKIKNKIKYLLGNSEIGKYKELWGKKKIVVIYTPSYGVNMEDDVDTEKYLNNKYKNYKVIWTDIDKIYKESKAIIDVLGNDDIILFTEGIDIKDNFLGEELAKEFIYKVFSEYNIEILPRQLVTYREKNII